MEKLIYVTWRPEGTDAGAYSQQILGQVAVDLAAAGARGVQVNVCDAEVADSRLNRPLADRQVDTVIGLWVDSARDETRLPLEEVLRADGSEIAGWLVTESVPLMPPVLPAGERTEGLSNMAFIRRNEGQDHASFMERWQTHHTTVAIETQSTFGYVQNAVVRPLTPGAFAVDAIVEELFPLGAKSDPHVFYDSNGDEDELQRRQKAMNDSVSTFVGQVGVLPSGRYVMSTPFA